MNCKLKVSLDIDGCICDFYTPYINKFGIPKRDSDITKNVIGPLRKDREFWLSLPVINRPNFEVRQYTTARCIPKRWIKDYLKGTNMPEAPVYQLFSHCLSKVPKIKMGGCDVHIDDSLSVFIDCNSKGIPCLLMDNESNQSWGPVGRIYSLDKDEVYDCYNLFIATMFPHFNELLNDFKR